MHTGPLVLLLVGKHCIGASKFQNDVCYGAPKIWKQLKEQEREQNVLRLSLFFWEFAPPQPTPMGSIIILAISSAILQVWKVDRLSWLKSRLEFMCKPCTKGYCFTNNWGYCCLSYEPKLGSTKFPPWTEIFEKICIERCNIKHKTLNFSHYFDNNWTWKICCVQH